MNGPLIRRGDGVYDQDDKLVAAWVKGTWYKPTIEKKGQRVLECIEPGMNEESRLLFDACEHAQRSRMSPAYMAQLAQAIRRIDKYLKRTRRGVFDKSRKF